MIYFICAREDFVPMPTPGVRWLDKVAEYELARRYWEGFGQDLSCCTWDKAHEFGYSYAALIEDGQIVSSAGVWRFSEAVWEVSAVSTWSAFRRLGYSRRVVTFVTAYILQEGRLPALSTLDDNHAMTATALRVGFHIIPKEQVWWKYPELPEF
jgi:RimJ/RimL family protein N-acetyltransferase